MNTNPQELMEFHRLLTANKEGFVPHYLLLAQNGKHPQPGFSWKARKLSIREAAEQMARGHNIGLAGMPDDDLVIVDIDNEKAVSDVKPSLCVRSRTRTGTHYYYFTQDKRCKVIIPTNDMGEVRSNGAYCVAPGSYFPTALKPRKEGEKEDNYIADEQISHLGKYTLEKRIKPTQIVYEEFPKIFREICNKAKKQEAKRPPLKKGVFTGKSSALFELRIEDVCGSYDERKTFPSLFHDSDTKHNTNMKWNLLHCWRHHVSLPPLAALSVMMGMYTCEEAGTPKPNSETGPSTLNLKDGKTVYQLWLFAKERGLIPKDDIMPKSALKYRLGVD